jgi:flagellar motility protein MotE (MotC chaperone)
VDNLDMEKSSYSSFERFLYIFLLPVLFAIVLIGVFLNFFDYNVKDTVYSIGRKIPGISSMVPVQEGPTENEAVNPANVTIKNEQEITALSAELSAKEAEIAALQTQLSTKESSIEQLEESLQQIILSEQSAVVDIEEYRAQLKALANMYSDMTTSKAAKILENLTMPELVLVLYEMKADDRGKVLAKMNPKTAADASIQIKDISESNRATYEKKATEARDERLKQDDPDAASELSIAELAQTFSVMTPASAAAIMLELNKTNSEQTVHILKAMDNNSRSTLLQAISDSSASVAAALTNKLGQ